MRRLNQRYTVVVHTDFSHVVAGSHVAGDANEASTKVGGPNIAWQVGGVKRGRAREERGARCHVQGRDGNGVNRRRGGAVLVVEFERPAVGVVQVARVLHIGLKCDRVASEIRICAEVVGGRHARDTDVHLGAHRRVDGMVDVGAAAADGNLVAAHQSSDDNGFVDAAGNDGGGNRAPRLRGFSGGNGDAVEGGSSATVL